MTQRIHDRLNDGFDNEILVRAIRTGEYVDQFTTEFPTPKEAKATLDRLPKCMKRKKKMLKNILATIWLIIGATFWVLLSSICPQIGLEDIGE